jgi:hypothetical protein
VEANANAVFVTRSDCAAVALLPKPGDSQNQEDVVKLRVYKNGEMADERDITQEEWKRLRMDTGSIVCGVQLADGEELLAFHKKRAKPNARVVRVDIWTT